MNCKIILQFNYSFFIVVKKILCNFKYPVNFAKEVSTFIHYLFFKKLIDMKTLLTNFLLLILVVLNSVAQDKTVSGKVTGKDDGLALPGVSVKVKSSTIGTQTDVDGNFSLKVPQSNSVLQFSFLGYQSREATIPGSNVLNIVLVMDTKELGEVVVTAFGITRTRNQVPYSAQQVTGEEVSKTRTNNFVQNLSGKVAGLDVKQTNSLGGSTNVILRGTKSITGDNQALFVVDGVPFSNANTNTADQKTARGGFDYGNAAADINPDNIQSVTVLKGAAASALYGSQGANGVILITTKKGSKGLGITVNSSISLGVVDKTTFATYQKEYGAGYGAFYEDDSGYFLLRDINGDGINDLVAPVLEDASYGGKFDPNLLVYQWDAFDPASPNFGKPRAWLPAQNDPYDFFEKPVSTNNSIFIDGGLDKGSFKLGYTRSDDQGFMPNSKIIKNLVNFGGSYNVTPKLTAGASINYSNIDGLGRYGTGYDGASARNLMTNFRQWWEVNVDIKDLEQAYFRNKQNVTWNWKDPDKLVPNFWDNPYHTRYENFQDDNRNRYFGNASLNYKMDWVNILGRITLDSYEEIQQERLALGSVAVSEYERFNRSYQETNFDLIANTDHNISNDLNFKALLGTNLRRQHTQSIRASTNGGLIVPRIYGLSNSLNSLDAPVEFDGTREVQGFFAGSTLSWKEMLTLDATIRRDQSSTLPKGNNIYYYPSVSGGFVFSKLLPNAGWLSYGKLLANYAEVGNDAPLYSVNDVYAGVAPFGSNPQSSVTGTKNNPDLKPERTSSTEVGAELSFVDSRLGLNVTYYNAKTVDQIIPVILSTATGYNSKFLNAGTIENKGWEVSLTGKPVQTKDFSWDVSINYSRNRNEVVKLFEGAENLVLGDFQGGVSLNATLGQPYGTIRGSNYVYTNGQKTVGANGRYLLSTTSNEVIGNANPSWVGGINNSLRFKDVSLSFLIDTRQGGDIFSLDLFYGMGTGLYPETVFTNDLGNPSRSPVAQGGGIILPGVKADGTPNDIRRNNSEGTLGYRQPTAGFVYDASYIKLREAAITYSLPSKLMSKMPFVKGIDLSLIGRNLWIIDKKLPYSDPEESLGAGNLQGYQSGAYPTTRTFTFNAKLRF